MNLQDYYAPKFHDSNIHSNDLLGRGPLSESELPAHESIARKLYE